MKNIYRITMLLALMMISSMYVSAQELVVIMNEDYTCDDPRGEEGNAGWNFKKGDALHVYKGDNGDYEYFGPYIAANAMIPKNLCHLPGERGEKYIVINVENLNLREGPSTRHKIYCYDSEYGGTFDPSKFLANPHSELGVYGNSRSWKAWHLPKGIRMPYLGKENGFYKTSFNNIVFYICAKYCTLK